MGPLRFELRSEDPQSPRMARLPYGPALLLLDHFIYLSCYRKKGAKENSVGEKVVVGFFRVSGPSIIFGESPHPAFFILFLCFHPLKPTLKKRYVYMVQSGIMNYKGTTAGAGMLEEKISEFIGSIRAIEGVVACAIVSRNGIVTEKCFDRDLNEPWLGALLANILSYAESFGRIIRGNSHESGTIRTRDNSMVVRSAGAIFPFAVIINARTDPSKVNNPMLSITKTVRESN